MARKTLVALAWTAKFLVGACILLYLVALAINWRDAEPSAAAIRMDESYRNLPAVPDEDNASVYAMGFAVAPGEDPMAMGRKRLAWLRRGEKSDTLILALDPGGSPFDYRATRHAAVQAYFDSCGPRDPACGKAFETARLTFDAWKDSEAWLLERYRALLKLPSWRDFVSRHFYAPLPSYSPVMDGQKVLLLHARIRAANGDATGARDLLAEDLRFWRRTLESTDNLVSKMIATAAILRHFKLGVEIVSALPAAHVREAMPAEWQVAITGSELSISRCMSGEWIVTSGVIRGLDSDFVESLPSDDSLTDRVVASLSKPFFQPQDTINHYAEQYLLAVQMIDGVPLTGYEAATSRMTELNARARREAWPPRSLYNMTGQVLISFRPDFGSYARRVSDLEGVRLSALAAASLHEQSVAPEDTPAALARSEFRNPYNDRAFDWDADDGAVVFRGLEPGERGEHRIH
jgi:hypothetical protein